MKNTRMDGWSNLLTLLGTDLDKRNHSRIHWDARPPEFFEQLYAGGGIPARIVDLIPEESLRHWIEFVDMDKEEQEARLDTLAALDVRGALAKTWKWGRAYGGACLHIVTDTTDPASPLQIGEKVIGLRDLSRWDLRILTTDIEYDFGSPNWGHPRIYYLNVQMGSQYKGYPIHWTRMIRFDGQLVPRRTYIRNNYWHDSILNRLYNSIRNYETANDSAAACLLDFNVDVFKMKNLANLISSGKEAIVKKRVETMSLTKSTLNSIFIDSDQEEYENKSRSIEGVAELLVHQANRLVADTDVPHTKLLGESPDGSNATGNSTSQQWYNFIATEQENYLRPKLDRLMSVIFQDEKKVGYKFKSLRVLDDQEKADLRLKVAQADQIYLDHQVLDATEVAESRFGGDEYSMETSVDWEARESGELVPGSSGPEGMGDDPMGVGGDQPPEGKSQISAEPSEPEPGPMRGHEGEGKDVTGRPSEEHPAPRADDDSAKGVVELAVDPDGNPGTEFDFRNKERQVPGGVKKEKTFISQMMSEPMRDPRTDPHIKGPGIPNRNRTVLPTRGNGIIAQSGFDFEKDAGQKGSAREVTQAEPNLAYKYDSKFKESDHPRAKDGKFGSGGGGSSPKSKGGESAPEEKTGLAGVKTKTNAVLSDPQKKAIAAYGGMGYHDMRKIMLNSKTPMNKEHFERAKENINELDKAIESSELAQDITLMRGMYGVPELASLDNSSIGKEIDSPSYWSTSSDEKIARQFTSSGGNAKNPSKDAVMLNIKMKKGQKALDVSTLKNELNPGTTNEKEMLLPRGTKFKVTGVSKKNGFSVLDLEVVSQDSKHPVEQAGSNIKIIEPEPFKWPNEDREDSRSRVDGKFKDMQIDSGLEASMKEFGKGTLKSSSGQKVTDPKQAMAIGLSEQRGDEIPKAATVIVRRGDNFLMGPTNEDGRWTLPGGMVEDGESAHQGALRELAEETGLKASKLKFLGSRLVEPKQGQQVVVHMYEHTPDEKAKPSPKKDPDKEVEKWHWVSSKDLPSDVLNNLKHPHNVALEHMGLLK